MSAPRKLAKAGIWALLLDLAIKAAAALFAVTLGVKTVKTLRDKRASK